MHKKEAITNVSLMWRKMKVFLFSRDTFIFLFFLLISAVFWLIMSLNKTYEMRITIPLAYVNTPQDMEFTANLPTNIVVKVKDKGTVLLSYAQQNFQPLTIDFNNYTSFHGQETWSIPTASTFDKEVKELLNPTTQMLDFYPRSINIEKHALSQKRVPIVAQTELTYARQYYPSDSLRITPDSTTLYGYKETLDTIRCIYTERIEASNLNDTLQTTCALAIPANCKVSPQNVKVFAPVEFYTEGKQVVPVRVLGVPKNLRVRTFPAEVEVTYMAGFSRFKSIIPADFTVTIQYNDLISSNQTTERLHLEQFPKYILKPKVRPEQVKWIIEFIN
jgi:hypothetical protein